MSSDHQAPGIADPDRDTGVLTSLPLVGLILALALIFASGGDRWLTRPAFELHQLAIETWIQQDPLVAAWAFLAVTSLCTAVSLPVGALLAAVGGALFGPWLGPVLAVIGTAAGSTVLFAAARPPLRRIARRQAGGGGHRVLDWIGSHAVVTTAALRLAPVVPTPLASLVAAASGARLSDFVLGTVLGSLPAALLFARAGAGLADGAVMATDEAAALIWPVEAALLAAAAMLVAAACFRKPSRKP